MNAPDRDDQGDFIYSGVVGGLCFVFAVAVVALIVVAKGCGA